MSQRKCPSSKRSFRVARALSAAVVGFTMSAARAEHDHGTCPDYSQYRGVLEQGRSEVKNGPSSSRAQDIRSGTSRNPPMFKYGAIANASSTYSYGDPTLQRYIYDAVSAEDSGDLETALKWWSAADDRVQSGKQGSEKSYVHALLLSRMADLKIVESQHLSNVSMTELPYLNWEQAQSLKLEMVPSELEEAYEFKRNGFKKTVGVKAEVPTVTGLPWNRALLYGYLRDFSRRREDVELPILCHLPLSSKWIQPKLFDAFESCRVYGVDSNSKSTNETLLADALRGYKESIRIRRAQPDKGSNALVVMDLVKASMVERALGKIEAASESLEDAVGCVTASSKAELPLYLFADDVQANLLSSKLFYKLVSRELSSYALKHLTPSQVRIVEERLEHYSPKRWGASVIAAYGRLGDKANTVRVFGTNGNDVFSINTNKLQIVEERTVIGRALSDVGAVEEFNQFVSIWKQKMAVEAPNNISAQAFNNSALASLYLRCDGSEALPCLKEYVRLSNLLPDGNREETQIRLDTSSGLSEDIKRFLLKAASTNGVTSTRPRAEFQLVADEVGMVESKAAHRLQKLDCLKLAEELTATASQLGIQEKYEDAGKLFDAAIDIRTKNLGVNDSQTVDTQIQLARMLIVGERWSQAEKTLEAVTSSLRAAKVKDVDQFRMALEMYADVLSRIQRAAESEKIYSELRVLADGTPKVIINEDMEFLRSGAPSRFD